MFVIWDYFAETCKQLNGWPTKGKESKCLVSRVYESNRRDCWVTYSPRWSLVCTGRRCHIQTQDVGSGEVKVIYRKSCFHEDCSSLQQKYTVQPANWIVIISTGLCEVKNITVFKIYKANWKKCTCTNHCTWSFQKHAIRKAL